MKVGIILSGVYWDKDGGTAIIEIPDPDMEEPPQKFTVKINSLIVADCKEWKEEQTA